MGMAASQARYLGLTARKTNVEYEGQQVNQARTALANQSANLFNQLLELQVPVAPSTADYTTVQYSYQDGSYNEAISDMTPISDSQDYNYSVTHYHFADVYRGQQELLPNPQVAYTTSAGGTKTPTRVGNHDLTLYDSTSTTLDQKVKAAYNQIYNDQPDFKTKVDKSEPIYYYTKDNNYYFASEKDLIASAESALDPAYPLENQTVKLEEYFALTQQEKVERTQKAMVQIDGSGRVNTIKYEDSTVVYTVNTETITDETAYADAMNQYSYDMAVYEKTIQDINAKTEAIQVEDRTLELRLRQLDTEQEALQTEMEAVKKVIEKNIESTFKTFE